MSESEWNCPYCGAPERVENVIGGGTITLVDHKPGCYFSKEPSAPTVIAGLELEVEALRRDLDDARRRIAALEGKPAPRRTLATWPEARAVLEYMKRGWVLQHYTDKNIFFRGEQSHEQISDDIFRFLCECGYITTDDDHISSFPLVYGYWISPSGVSELLALAAAEASNDER